MLGRKVKQPRRQSGARGVILVGFMGAGKSSVGRALAEQLGWTFEDLDDRIEQREARMVPQIFRDSGEVDFRRAEHAALKELMRELQAAPERIVALGGGAFVQKENARLVEAGAVSTVFLDAGVDELWRRCWQQAEHEGMERPLRGSLEHFSELYEARRRHYLKASFRQETGGKTIQEIATEVIQALGLGRKREKRGEK
ncbi:MAG: shikimate kinase [Candidatus Sulfotelmatobacter sp.]